MAKLDYSTKITTITGDETDLTSYKGKTLLIVNTASKCGFTPQYKGLEEMWQRHKGEDFAILGFPCNQFGKQEPGAEDDIASFCQLNYGVTFPMHAKVDVNGKEAHPLFEQLKEGAPGLLGSKMIKWNFTKFLVAPDGTIVKRYSPRDEPAKVDADLPQALAPYL